MRSLEILETTRTVMTEGLTRILESLHSSQQSHANSYARAIRELSQEMRDLGVRSPPALGAVADHPPSAGFGWETPGRAPGVPDPAPESGA